MYLVTVILLQNRECIDSRAFAFGTWKEIGLWLDHYGYNDEAYELKIQFGTFGS
jgi:hypothetical protein